jgi:hypothetical protein
MASYQTQVMALTGITISSSGTYPTEAQLTQFLTDGAKEVINSLPPGLLPLCASQATFTSTAAGSESETLNTGNILNVFRNDGDIDQPCRRISADDKGRVSDESDMSYAKISDPVYYIENNKINALPDGGSCKYSEVQYPAVAYSVDAIAAFPDEAEYLVPLYASVKALQNAMAAKAGNSDVTGALTALEASVVNAEDEIEDANKMVANIVLGVAEIAESAVDTDTTSSEIKTAADAITTSLAQINTHSFDDEDTFTTTTSQLTRVKDALDKVSDIVNGNQPSATTDAFGAQAAEDIELVTSSLNIAQTEIQRANAHLSEWSSILQGALAQAQGFVSEVQARGDWTSAKAQVWNGYFASAGAYAQAAQTYLASAQGYAGEVQARLSVITIEYTWMEKQQAKLEADYEKGLQKLRG